MLAQLDVPLRPMTLGELLDSAAAVLRRRALPLLSAAAVLAALEQVALVPLRRTAFLSAPRYGPAEEHFGAWWVVVAIGFAMEATIIVLLSAPAAAAVAAQIGGRTLPHRGLWRAARPAAVIPLALVVGVVCGLAALALLVPWPVVFGLLLLTGPALVVERSGNPLGRSAGLAVRSGMRGCRVLAAAYLAWFAVRFALGSSWVELAGLVAGWRPGWQPWLVPVAWGVANTVAYASIACVAAVLLVETRVRTEGLDIAIGRSQDPAAVL